MKLYLIRHTNTIESENSIILGTLGGNLSEKGILKANSYGRFLKNGNFGISKIVTSDLKRTIDTGKIINKYLDKKNEQLEILRERSAGQNEGKKESEIDWDEYEKKSLSSRKHLGGETFIDVKRRAEIFLKGIFKEDILVISHSVFILMLIGIISNLSLEESLKINIKNKLVCIDLENNSIDFIDIK